jgi:hypothetical protein
MPFDPQDADRLLAGKVSMTDPELGRLAEGLAALRDGLIQPLPEDMAARHLAAMVEAASAGGPVAAGVPAVRRRFSRRAVVAIGMTAGLFATGSALAATGNLPDPVQNVVSHAADNVGIHWPEHTPRPRPTPHANGHGADDDKTFTNNSHAPEPGTNNGVGEEHRNDNAGDHGEGQLHPTPQATHHEDGNRSGDEAGDNSGSSGEHEGDNADHTPQPEKTVSPEHTSQPQNGGSSDDGSSDDGSHSGDTADHTPSPEQTPHSD